MNQTEPSSPASPDTVTVSLGARSYPVLVGAGLLEEAGARLRPLLRRPWVPVLADATAWAAQGARFVRSLEAAGIAHTLVEIAPGEASKSFAGLERVVEALLEAEVERGDLVIAFGGGVAGDLAGFAAGITKRGMDFAQIPTTLLAQVDSSVGGKTAINARAGKNMAGLFWQPRLVLADTQALSSLPARDIRAGWAEIIKYGFIDDPAFARWCADHRAAALALDPATIREAVRRSVAAKARIVAQDEREGGVRALLNLGHTFAHALEAAAGFDETRLRHGEAVACGMALAARFSVDAGLMGADDAAWMRGLIAASGLPARLQDLHPSLAPGQDGLAPDAMLAAMAHDKKNEGGRLTLIALKGIGQAFVMKNAPVDAVRATLERACREG